MVVCCFVSNSSEIYHNLGPPLENSTFGLDLYLNALIEVRVVERKTKNVVAQYVFRISKSCAMMYQSSDL